MTMKKYVSVAVGVVCLDAITKLLAYTFLPYNEYVNVLGKNLRFYLAYNMGSSGTKAQEMAGRFLNPNLYLLLVGCFALLIGIALIATRNHHFKLWQKVLSLMLILVFFGFVIEKSANSLVYIPGDYFVSWFTKLGGIVFYLGFVVLIKDYWLRLILIGCLSGGIGNLLSHVYPPFAVIDFIYSPFLYEWFHLDICNMADILIDLFLVLAILRFVKLVVVKGHQKLFTNSSSNVIL